MFYNLIYIWIDFLLLFQSVFWLGWLYLYTKPQYDRCMESWPRYSSVWGPFHWRFFHRNSNSMEISFHSQLDSNTVIATKFCTWHDSCAVVACAKICCDLMASNGVMARRSFHRIWIAGEKTVNETGPWSLIILSSSSTLKGPIKGVLSPSRWRHRHSYTLRQNGGHFAYDISDRLDWKPFNLGKNFTEFYS